MELEERKCPICKNSYRVLPSSKQIYDSKYCEELAGARNLKDKFVCPSKHWGIKNSKDSTCQQTTLPNLDLGVM